MRYYWFFVSALLAAATLPASGQTPKPAAAAPLRHLLFSLKSATSYTSELRGVRDIADKYGPSALTTQVRDNAVGTVSCDVVSAHDTDLMLDVKETLRGETTPISRLVLHSDGQITYLPDQKPLPSEAAILIPFLARGYIGATPHSAGESWSVDDNFENYKATTKFKVTAIRAPNDVAFEFDETFTIGGVQGTTGYVRGHLSYDPTKLVLRDGNFDTLSRKQEGDHYQVVSDLIEFNLKEDSFAKT